MVAFQYPAYPTPDHTIILRNPERGDDLMSTRTAVFNKTRNNVTKNVVFQRRQRDREVYEIDLEFHLFQDSLPWTDFIDFISMASRYHVIYIDYNLVKWIGVIKSDTVTVKEEQYPKYTANFVFEGWRVDCVEELPDATFP
jgi:hypothetical protein